jgi:type I restriction enzyme S subunit
MAMNQSCYGINGIGPYFNYFILKEAVTKLRQNTHGAVFDTITTSTFATIRIAYPGNNLALKFDGLVKEKFEYIEANVKENISLTTLRDTLLPKLISGEVQVSEL